jgi:hypothetical protein
MYNQTTRPVNCNLGTINLQTAPANVIEDHLEGYMECLMHVWFGPVEDAGYWMPRPSVTVYTAPIQTACGLMDDTENAFYCAANQQTYYGINLIKIVPDVSNERLVAEIIMAHEFAHAMQYRTQILQAQWWAQDNADTEEDAMDISRRKEMQADCWAGMAIGAIGVSIGLNDNDEATIESVFHGIALPYPSPLSTHGWGVNRAAWAVKGIHTTNLGTCNTWIVDSSEVTESPTQWRWPQGRRPARGNRAHLWRWRPPRLVPPLTLLKPARLRGGAALA